jgi:4-amino-4-deoxy-L-arabinose transferase-like glycosyltransferase
MLLWLLIIAFVHPVSHDESQYLAATVLVARGLVPYRDFAYLQTPLQPFVFAPFAWLFPDRLFLASRLANVALSAATLGLVYGAVRRAGAGRGPALGASLLLVACHSFIWASGVARNDMLPAALVASALWIEMSANRRGQHALAGVALGLAAAAKISYALPAITVATSFLLNRDRVEQRSGSWLCAGALAGFAPAIVAAFASPDAFLFEVFTYGIEAPLAWYREIGEPWVLGSFRFLQLLGVAAMGPALLAGVALTVRLAKDPDRWLSDRPKRLLLAAAIGGLASAALNRPFNTPYLVPALPPLFILVGLELSTWRPPRLLRVAGFASIAIGLVWPVSCLGEALMHGSLQAMDAERRSDELGGALRVEAVSGAIGGLSGQYLIDTGYRLDPRFSAGPFMFRTTGLLTAEQAAKWHIVTRDQYGELASSPPEAIIVGGETNKGVKPDVRLAAIAASLGYVPAAHVRKYTIWIRSRAGSNVRPLDSKRH